MTRTAMVATISVLAVLAAGSASGQSDAGLLAFNNACRTCHTVKDADNRLGPHLAGVVGRKAGSVAGYTYSDAMARAGLTWDEATLDRFLANPDAVVPGHNMKPYTGITSDEDRRRIIDYLKAQPSG